MTQKSVDKGIDIIRLAIVAIALLISSLTMLSFRTVTVFGDVWQQLGISEKEAGYSIQGSFLYGYLQHGGARNYKNIAVGDRAAVASDLLAFSKKYVQTEAFKKAYEESRKRAKPTEPEKAKTEKEIRDKNIADLSEGLVNLEKGMKTSDAEMKKVLQGSYDMLQQQLKEYKNPASEQVKNMVEYEQMQYESRLKEYNDNMKKWEKEYPENHLQFVKSRLQQMLAATANVDYSAQLIARNGKKYFVRSEYEQKSNNWKYAFRAGKEVTETARLFAQQWIKEIN